MHRDPDHGLQSVAHADHIPDWQRAIWRGCAIGLGLLIISLVGLVAYMLVQVLDLLRLKTPDNAFVFAGITLLNSSLLRLLAILIGGAIAFVGLAVSFFAHQKATSVDANLAREQLGSAKAALATNSPGIVAVIIGALVIIVALFLRGTHTYIPSQNGLQGVALPQGLPTRSEVLKEEPEGDQAPRSVGENSSQPPPK